MHKDSISHRKLHQERRAKGLCRCGNIPEPGFARCQKCRDYRRSCPSHKRVRTAEDWRSIRHRIKLDVLTHYSGGQPNCRCCGATIIEFLTLDHMENNGAEHRRSIGLSGSRFYRWIKANNYPSGYQVLCMNCNLGRHHNSGVCPHHQIFQREGERAYRHNSIKLAVLTHYSGGIPKCSCCGEDNTAFLTIDHVNNDGNKHREAIGSGSHRMYQWIKSNGFPTGFRVLCMNCNFGRQLNHGICPCLTIS
jgi:hypothetical protein